MGKKIEAQGRANVGMTSKEGELNNQKDAHYCKHNTSIEFALFNLIFFIMFSQSRKIFMEILKGQLQ